jgi:hypothetical protein
MTRLRGPNLLVRLLRLLVVVGCVLPFASPRVAAGSAAPLPIPVPSAPTNEDDENQREETAEEQTADPRLVRLPNPLPPAADRLARLSVHSPLRPTAARAGPTSEDPFRNGLGTPYRC